MDLTRGTAPACPDISSTPTFPEVQEGQRIELFYDNLERKISSQDPPSKYESKLGHAEPTASIFGTYRERATHTSVRGISLYFSDQIQLSMLVWSGPHISDKL